MRPRPVGLAFQERGPFPRAGAADGFAGGLEDGHHVISVHGHARHPVEGCPAGHVGIPRRVPEGDFGGVLIVLADEEHGQLPDGSQVQPFVEGSVVHGAVAEEGHRHLVGLHQSIAVSCAGRLKDAGTDDAARPHHAHFGREEVHAPPTPAGTSALAAVELGDQLPRWEALGEGMSVTPVGAEHGIVLAELGADADRNRLLPDLGVAGAVNQSPLVRSDELLLAAAALGPLTIKGEQLMLAGRGGRSGQHGTSSRTGLVSEPILSISTVTVSPARSQTGGFLEKPTPCGVPVRITVPGRSVVLALKNEMIVGTSKIMSLVPDSCMTWPFKTVRRRSSAGSGISSRRARHGPIGAKVSNVLPRHHWPPPPFRCQSRAETSLAQV